MDWDKIPKWLDYTIFVSVFILIVNGDMIILFIKDVIIGKKSFREFLTGKRWQNELHVVYYIVGGNKLNNITDKVIHQIWNDAHILSQHEICLLREELVLRGFVSKEEITTKFECIFKV